MDFDIDKLSIEELERQSCELAAEREKAKTERDKAQKHLSIVSQKQNIIDEILNFRKSQLEEDGEKQSAAKAVNEVDKTATILESVRRSGTKRNFAQRG